MVTDLGMLWAWTLVLATTASDNAAKPTQPHLTANAV